MAAGTIENKKIIITGASKGLGAVCAQEFSRLGAQLVLMARTKEKLEEVKSECKNPDQHMSVAVDLTDSLALGGAVDKARRFLGAIDVVLHVAGGGLGLRDPLLNPEQFLMLFKLNLAAAAEINRLVVPDMQQRKRGNLVHVGSIASSEGVGSVGYNAVKAALAAYVRTLGNYLAGWNIVATGILPGGFIAPGNAMDRLKEKDPGILEHFIRDRLPRGVLGSARELVPMILLLCSDEASMMAGCMVPIDAGEGKAYCW